MEREGGDKPVCVAETVSRRGICDRTRCALRQSTA
jgi:hypothetical protein